METYVLTTMTIQKNVGVAMTATFQQTQCAAVVMAEKKSPQQRQRQREVSNSSTMLVDPTPALMTAHPPATIITSSME